MGDKINEGTHNLQETSEIQSIPDNKVIIPPLRVNDPYWLVDKKRFNRMFVMRMKKAKAI